jgi:flagellar hook assembly protein FlgD
VRVARQRVENYASGFLAAGARAVFALGWQPGEDVVDGLFGMHTTIDGLFMTEFREGSPDWLPYHGWIGWKPDLYFDSARTAGAMLHLDPDQDHGFLRSVTGDLAFTTDEWVTGVPVDPDDHEPPVLSGLSVGQPDDTLPAGDDALPVFTPNGDGVSDMVSVGLTLSEGAYLDVSVAKRDGTVVRHALAWAGAGTAAVSWDGRNDAGRLVKDGRFDITVAPRDAAGNEGDPGTVSVKVLTAMREPSVSPGLFFPLDADTIAQLTTSTVTLAAPATISWRMVDDSGDVVRTAFTDEPLDVGIATWDWDGLDDAGIAVRPGVYTSVVSATTANGTYSHRLAVRVMAFDVRGRLTIARSSKSVLRILSAEPLAGSPVVVVKQRGLDPYPLKVTAVGPDRYRARWTPRPGKAGRVTITIAATDAEGGTNTQVLVGQLR